MTIHPLLQRLEVHMPVVQAPMAGVSSAAMAAAVSSRGGLGSLGVGAMNADQARTAIREVRALGGGPLNVNLFAHAPALANAEKEASWIQRLKPEFERVGAVPPAKLREIYTSFLTDDDMLAMLLEERPQVVSFHFGLPGKDRIQALKAEGMVLLATATNLEEARFIEAVGIDAVIAQGYEAGGHRGMFDPDVEDSQLGTLALTRLLVRSTGLPVIAAGGIMDGAGIAAVLAAGAVAAQLGTAFVATDESLADAAYRERLFSTAAHHTVMTRAISGRPARTLPNDFTRWGACVPDSAVPAYPIAYDAGKSLHAAAKAAGRNGYGAQWAGQGAPLARAMPVHALMEVLADELARARE